MFRKSFILLLVLVFFILSCTNNAPLGTKKNPVKMFFVPSMEAGKVITNGEKIAQILQEKTGYFFKIAVPTSYAAVIEAMGTDEADIGWLATFAYILAHENFDAEVGLTTIRYGQKKYRGQFVARANSDIKSIDDIQGKVIAYTDAASTSGFIYPSAILKQQHINPANSFMAGGHPAAMLAVLEGKADVGCSYWSPIHNGVPQDARKALLETYPNIFEKIKPIGYTDWIPNDTVTFRKGFPSEMKEKIIDALIEAISTKEGKQIFKKLYSIDGLYRSNDSDYDVVRTTLKTLDADASQFLKD